MLMFRIGSRYEHGTLNTLKPFYRLVWIKPFLKDRKQAQSAGYNAN